MSPRTSSARSATRLITSDELYRRTLAYTTSSFRLLAVHSIGRAQPGAGGSRLELAPLGALHQRRRHFAETRGPPYSASQPSTRGSASAFACARIVSPSRTTPPS